MLWPCKIVSPLNFLCNSTQQPSSGMENPSNYNHTFQPTVDSQGTIHVYHVLSTIERHSVELTEYANINKPKKQMVSPKGPPCQTKNFNASPNQESQKLFPSGKESPVYDQPNLSKKEFPPQGVNVTENMDSSPNGESQKVFPSDEVRHGYTQPDLSKEEKKK